MALATTLITFGTFFLILGIVLTIIAVLPKAAKRFEPTIKPVPHDPDYWFNSQSPVKASDGDDLSVGSTKTFESGSSNTDA